MVSIDGGIASVGLKGNTNMYRINTDSYDIPRKMDEATGAFAQA
jgi:hypothetical protein